jgi:hypothetical protein
MDHEVVNAQKQSALNLLTKRGARFLQDEIVGGCKINEIIAMNENGRDLGQLARFTKEENVFVGQRFRHPPARIAREELHCIATCVFCDEQRIVDPALDRSMKTYSWHLPFLALSQRKLLGAAF